VVTLLESWWLILVKKILAYLFSLTLILTVFLGVINYCCFDEDFYYKHQQAHNTAKDIGVSEDGLKQMTTILLDYLQDKRDNIDLSLSVNNQEREVYDTREKQHMVDVKDLYQKALLVLKFSALIFIVSFLIYLFIKGDFKLLLNSFNKVFIAFIALLLAIGLYALVDFDKFWTNFHQLFFDNDLWLLDPNTELMIRLLPSSFFSALVFRIIYLCLLIFLIIYIILLLGRKYDKRRSLLS